MKRLALFISFTLIIACKINAALSISNVVCQQQYPWNGKVDIDFELYGGENNTNIWVSAEGFDKSSNKVIALSSLTGPGILEPTKIGRHRITWDSSKDCPNLITSAFSITLSAINGRHLYMIIDLSNGSEALNYPVYFLLNEPDGGWTEEFKTTKLVLRMIEPGKFVMGSPEDEIGHYSNEVQHEVVLTKPFYMGVFEVTQKQWQLVMGTTPSYYSGELRPVENITYNMIRGETDGAGWPANNLVENDSFIGRLRNKTDLLFDLPTEAQWEYACRAGTTTALNSGKNITDKNVCSEVEKVGRYSYNKNDGKGGYSQHTKVGSYLPNAWGLYDMHGNVMEWCLDWNASYNGNETDPKGSESGTERVLRGGSWFGNRNCARVCRSAYRGHSSPNLSYFRADGPSSSHYGFRIVVVEE